MKRYCALSDLVPGLPDLEGMGVPTPTVGELLELARELARQKEELREEIATLRQGLSAPTGLDLK